MLNRMRLYLGSEYLLEDLKRMGIYVKAGIIVGIVMLLIWLQARRCRKKEIKITQVAGIFSMTVYGIVMLGVAFLNREPGSRGGIDWGLFSTWGTTVRMHMYVIENVIMFLPMGVLLPYIWKAQRKFWICLLTVMTITIGIELMQFVTKLGYCQVDDVVMNTLGGVIGYLIQWIIRSCLSKLKGIFIKKIGSQDKE